MANQYTEAVQDSGSFYQVIDQNTNGNLIKINTHRFWIYFVIAEAGKTTPSDIYNKLVPNRKPVYAEVNGQVWDMQKPLKSYCFLDFIPREKNEDLQIFDVIEEEKWYERQFNMLQATNKTKKPRIIMITVYGNDTQLIKDIEGKISPLEVLQKYYPDFNVTETSHRIKVNGEDWQSRKPLQDHSIIECFQQNDQREQEINAYGSLIKVGILGFVQALKQPFEYTPLQLLRELYDSSDIDIRSFITLVDGEIWDPARPFEKNSDVLFVDSSMDTIDINGIHSNSWRDEKIKRRWFDMMLFRHSISCQMTLNELGGGECQFSYCTILATLVKNLIECRNEENCKIIKCIKIRRMMHHYHNCSYQVCIICDSIKHAERYQPHPMSPFCFKQTNHSDSTIPLPENCKSTVILNDFVEQMAFPNHFSDAASSTINNQASGTSFDIPKEGTVSSDNFSNQEKDIVQSTNQEVFAALGNIKFSETPVGSNNTQCPKSFETSSQIRYSAAGINTHLKISTPVNNMASASVMENVFPEQSLPYYPHNVNEMTMHQAPSSGMVSLNHSQEGTDIFPPSNHPSNQYQAVNGNFSPLNQHFNQPQGVIGNFPSSYHINYSQAVRESFPPPNQPPIQFQADMNHFQSSNQILNQSQAMMENFPSSNQSSNQFQPVMKHFPSAKQTFDQPQAMMKNFPTSNQSYIQSRAVMENINSSNQLQNKLSLYLNGPLSHAAHSNVRHDLKKICEAFTEGSIRKDIQADIPQNFTEQHNFSKSVETISQTTNHESLSLHTIHELITIRDKEVKWWKSFNYLKRKSFIDEIYFQNPLTSWLEEVPNSIKSKEILECILVKENNLFYIVTSQKEYRNGLRMIIASIQERMYQELKKQGLILDTR